MISVMLLDIWRGRGARGVVGILGEKGEAAGVQRRRSADGVFRHHAELVSFAFFQSGMETNDFRRGWSTLLQLQFLLSFLFFQQ